ncbi:beta-ketoacyl reductase, partial [Streptomyces sp. NPDC058471]|uniref:beta-ketoacyl reductase n=1 Tax=Streptomyces sp. NPDC058471 TaxID=3346516 RepID=UPI003651286F
STDENVVLPFEWTNAHLHATHSTELRVHITLNDAQSSAALLATDPAGNLVASGTLALREATREQIRGNRNADHLYRVDFVAPPSLDESDDADEDTLWVLGAEGVISRALGAEAEAVSDLAAALAGLGDDEVPPARIVVDATDSVPATDPAAVRGATARSLEQIQALLSEERLAATELVWVTRLAVGEGAQDLAHAPLWGLVRSARAEHADRSLRLVDLGEEPDDLEELAHALSVRGEPEIAVRDGEVRVARLIRARATDTTATQPPRLDPEGTVLITGGTGELGRQIAHHLVQEHGAHHLVLTSRQGPDHPDTPELITQLREQGAQTVDIRACDITDPQQTEQLITTLERPLTAVFHLAGILDDGLLTSQTPQRLATVLAP